MQRVEKLQCKTLQVVYNNCMTTYDDLLVLGNKLKIYQRHLQFLAIRIYKSKNKLNPSLLRRGISLLIPNANTQK